jgi:hypothetical protein
MNPAVLAFLPEAIETLIGVFRSLRSARDAERVVEHLRGLGPTPQADIHSVARDVARARHSDGTSGSD